MSWSPNASGIPPDRSLPLRHKFTKLTRLPNSPGTVPLSRLLDRSNDSKYSCAPNSLGIPPVKSLPDRFNVRNPVSVPRSAGIRPAISGHRGGCHEASGCGSSDRGMHCSWSGFLLRSIAVTRGTPPADPLVTPSHWPKNNPVDQFNEPLPSNVSRTESSVLQSDTNSVFVVNPCSTSPPAQVFVAACVVALAGSDHGPSPAALAARTSTSYSPLPGRPVISLSRSPPPTIHALSTTVESPPSVGLYCRS